MLLDEIKGVDQVGNGALVVAQGTRQRLFLRKSVQKLDLVIEGNVFSQFLIKFSFISSKLGSPVKTKSERI